MNTAALMIAASLLRAEPTPASGGFASSGVERRVVKLFDFNEAALGNYEPVPMNWSMHHASGYPRYLEARFDAERGHAAAPSMVLRLLGGNVAAVYQGQDIPAHPTSDYQVQAWVRTESLRHARARLSAHFLDRAMKVIDGTQRWSEPLGGNADGGAWRRVTIDLPGGVTEGRWIGLTFALEQPDALREAAATPRPIRREDVQGAAWIDDVTILRLPRAWIDPESVSHVLDPEQAVVLSVCMDAGGGGARLDAELMVRDSDGREAARRSWAPWPTATSSVRVELPDLGPGWYRAEFVVRAESRELLRRETRFARLAPAIGGTADMSSGIGVLLNSGLSSDYELSRRNVAQLSVSAVKTPLWQADLNESMQPELSRFLHRLRGAGVRVIGVWAEPPASLAAKFDPSRRGLLDILSQPVEQWRAAVDEIVARHGPTVSAWQLGRDSDTRLMADARWPAATEQLRRCIEAMSGTAAMVAPWNALLELTPERRRAAIVSLAVPSALRAEQLPGQLGNFATRGIENRWATLELLDPDGHYESAVLADLARRIVLARAAGVETVFVPQPWFEREDGRGRHLMPYPDFLVVRTLCQALAGTGAPTQISKEPDLSIWLFPRADGRGTVVTWRGGDDPNAPALRWQFGAEAVQYDLFGRRIGGNDPAAIDAMPASSPFVVGVLPTIITPVETASLRTQVSVRFARPRVSPMRAVQDNALLLRNSESDAVRTEVRIRVPAGWQIVPSVFTVSLPPGVESSLPLTIQMPANEPIGRRSVDVALLLDRQTPQRFSLGVPLDVQTPDLDVEAITQTVRGRLIVRQQVTNRSGEMLNLRGIVRAPDRAMISRLILKLAPGETTVSRYELSDARMLAGKTVRVSLEQIDGPRRHNLLIPIE